MEEIIVVTLCLALNSCLSAFEMAFVSMPKIELRRMARDGNRVAQKLEPLRELPERTLSVIQIGITLVGALSAAVGGAGASESIEPYFRNTLGLSGGHSEVLSIVVVVIPLTYLSVVIGELVPKTIALRNPKAIVFLGARFLFIADKVLGPIISLLENSTKLIVKLFFSKSVLAQPHVEESAVELTHMTKHHRQYILNMASIERKSIKDIYVPWEKVIHVDMNAEAKDVVNSIFKHGHTRLPVTQNDQVVGVINAKEVLAALDSGITDWLSVMRPAVRVKSTDLVLTVLRMLQEKRAHIALVDENRGIVSSEDITEEIFGEFYDEFEDGRVHRLIAARSKTKFSSKNPT